MVRKDTPCSKCKVNPRYSTPTAKRSYAYCRECKSEKQNEYQRRDPERYERIRRTHSLKQIEQRKKQRAINALVRQHPLRLQQVIDASRLPKGEGCVEWPGAIQDVGYGIVSWQGRSYPAHRLVLELKLGRPLADGMESLHSCNNRACIAWWHLSEDTHKRNMEQASREGRMVRRDGRRRLSDEAVRSVRSRLSAGESTSSISKDLAVNQSVIWCLENGRTYKDVLDEPPENACYD